MSQRAWIVIAVLGLVVVLLPSFIAVLVHERPAAELGSADRVPAHAVGFEAVDNTPTHPPGIRTVRAASAGKALRTPVGTAGSVNGYPCGGDLPPCWVLERESMMAADPPRVWNGNCYLPVGAAGQCGASTASGLWQFLRSTWNGFGGYLNAADAPVHVQNEKARLLWNGGAGCSHWAAC